MILPFTKKMRMAVPNPLKSDPSQTATIRRMFCVELSRCYEQFRIELNQYLVVTNTLGLGLTTNTKHAGKPDADKIALFRQWYDQQMAKTFKTTGEKAPPNVFWNKFITDAYMKGARRAFKDVAKFYPGNDKKAQALFDGSRAQFMKQNFQTQVAKARVDALAERLFGEIKGNTDEMKKLMVRNLSEAMAKGATPKKVGELLSNVLGISKNRGLTIARTEVVRAQAEGQLDALEALGVTHVGISVEWVAMKTACDICRDMQGVIMTIAQARGMIPRHPNCRCSFRVVKTNNQLSKSGKNWYV